jgi:ubiquinone/menaquinone biosynthesis C-methylase UbiE
MDKEGHMIYMNFGYARLEPNAEKIQLKETDEMDRYCIQLYHHVVGSINLHGLDVLEVGCGRGGGTSYVMRYLKPKSITGIDISEKSITFCKRRYAIEGLSFLHGDAEALPLSDNSFDIIVNIESSHCYGYMERFLKEVYRVLRPNGYFLFADYRDKDRIDTLRSQLVSSGLEILKEERISLNVLKALEIDDKRKLNIIQKKVPWILQMPFRAFAAIQGTEIYEQFRVGDFDYRSFILRKGEK